MFPIIKKERKSGNPFSLEVGVKAVLVSAVPTPHSLRRAV